VEAERRQVTILFADMVDFTTFSDRSGEEAAFTLMRSLSKLMDDAVREQGGVVQSFTGDGIMAVFGAPVAFEDAPLRACRAAISILQRLKTDGPDLEIKHGVRPHLRIGLNTGAAVVGKVQGGADAGVTVLGDTVNFAARLQAVAEPDSAVMSEATHRSVQGMVEASFAGEHSIKGKSEAQKVYRLDGIRHGATRFGAAVSRGLSTFVGREHELEVLERGLAEARSQLRVIDIAAEPGMGKSRLLHEFRHRVGKERAFVLSGNCSPDGQQTPFLPFVEVVRGLFRVSAGEAEREVAQKLEIGLTSLGLHSARNLGLLLHLLGLKVPEGALTGLDGVLIGLRTRELLQQLLDARCSLSPVVMVIEDLHWIDSVSEELLGKVVDSESKRKLLLLTTHRPESASPSLDRAVVTQLHLEPLPVGDIRRLVQARLGVEVLPEALARQVAEKAEGNPLFAEEIVSYLTERELLHAKGGQLEFDPGAVAAVLPTSVQSILNARVDRLLPKDRALLQAASVIGRRFDSELLAVAAKETDIDNRLAAMQALDLVRTDGGSTGYVFKHALVRDALYESLLTERRQGLHARIAEEIEHRSGNRLAEVAEILAYHYSRTSRVGKAFAYLSLAGTKSLSIYSLDEAATHLTAALALLEKNPDCASDAQATDFLLSYVSLLDLSAQVKRELDVVSRYLARIDRLGDDLRAVIIRTSYVLALVMNARYREAAAMQRETSRMADRLGDAGSKAWALVIEIWLSTLVEPKPLHEFEILKTEAIKAASDTSEAIIQKSARELDGPLQVAWASKVFRLTWFVIGVQEVFRGRMNDARDAARELMQVGRLLKDPRSTELGFFLLSIIALWSDSYTEALEYSEQSLAVAVTPVDTNLSTQSKLSALVALRRTEEGAMLLEAYRRRCVTDGLLQQLNGTDTIFGVCKILQGNLRGGLRLIEEAILRREKEGSRFMADWSRLGLAEIYLQMIAGNEKPPPLPILIRNLPTVLRVMITAHSRIPDLLKRVMANPQFDPAGHHIGRAQMVLGLFYKVKKKHALAVQHLTEAKRVLSQFGQTPILARVDTALAELEQSPINRSSPP
jgi:class 3 adenylate cyclase